MQGIEFLLTSAGAGGGMMGGGGMGNGMASGRRECQDFKRSGQFRGYADNCFDPDSSCSRDRNTPDSPSDELWRVHGHGDKLAIQRNEVGTDPASELRGVR